jgi:RNA polymerase primary sigma factor
VPAPVRRLGGGARGRPIRRSTGGAHRPSGPTIRIPAGASGELAAIRRAEHELARSAPGPASEEAIAERTGFSVRRVRSLRGAASVTASLDAQVGEDGSTLTELIADRGAADPWRHADERETHRQIQWLLGTLPARHREVLVRRYGLGGGAPETHAQIAGRLAVGE